jgi:hypothetical protein
MEPHKPTEPAATIQGATGSPGMSTAPKVMVLLSPSMTDSHIGA